MYTLLQKASNLQVRCSLRHDLCRFSTSQRVRSNLITPEVNYEAKYAERLQKRAEQQGLSVAELRQRLKEEARKQREKAAAATQVEHATTPQNSHPKDAKPSSASPAASMPLRKDSSPVKPLSSILNLEKLLQTPHTAEQISLLWQAYHASRSKGTGRGYLCATVPIDAYEKMISAASRYPFFVIPVPREGAQVSEQQTSDEQRAYEFYFMEWAFHGAPADPLSTYADPFAKPRPSANPHISTVLFTPLQEYKLRTSFATPYLVMTNYTELARSHGIVLLRGEITPSASNNGDAGGDGRYMLGQQDAQLLALSTQKFYLWDEGKTEREELLRAFHENPAGFKWEELLKHADLSA